MWRRQKRFATLLKETFFYNKHPPSPFYYLFVAFCLCESRGLYNILERLWFIRNILARLWFLESPNSSLSHRPGDVFVELKLFYYAVYYLNETFFFVNIKLTSLVALCDPFRRLGISEWPCIAKGHFRPMKSPFPLTRTKGSILFFFFSNRNCSTSRVRLA